MNIEKYRKWYLQENWAENRFKMIKYNITNDVIHNRVFNTAYGRIHPLVLSGKAFWINYYELCIGYELVENQEIHRPIFSHDRQYFLDKVNIDIRIAKKFWNKVKSKYFITLLKIKKLPIECADYIVRFIY